MTPEQRREAGLVAYGLIRLAALAFAVLFPIGYALGLRRIPKENP